MAKLSRKKKITIISIASLIFITGFTILMVFIFSRSSNRLTKRERILFEQQVILCNEIIGSSYSSNTDSYEVCVSDIDKHLRSVELLSKNDIFNVDRPVNSNEDYDNYVKVSYLGLDNKKNIYHIYYIVYEDSINGCIRYEDYEFNFLSTFEDEEYITNITYNNVSYSCSSIKEKEYNIKINESTIIYIISNSVRITTLANTYDVIALSGKLQVSTIIDDKKEIFNVSLLSSENKYLYEFGNSKEIITTRK